MPCVPLLEKVEPGGFKLIFCRPEINIKPWEALLEDLKEANRRTRWVKREPYAYWKGNPEVAQKRQDLLKCNVSEKQDWNARVYAQVRPFFSLNGSRNFINVINNPS